MSTTSTETALPDSLEYAESLYQYAAQRLDPFSLRCWIIRRLMLDDGLEHPIAEDVFDRVLASANDVGGRETARLRGDRRREPFRTLRSSTRDWASRRHLHRPTGHACA
jgi:hypothetical protein